LDASRTIKFGIVGCGSIGSRHLAVVSSDPRAEVVAICDIDIPTCQKYSQLHGGVPYYTDYRQMYREANADVVSICTPHSCHAPMAIEAARAGKHALVEKPMALTVRDAEEVIAAAREHHTELMVVKQNRYNVPISLVRNVLDEGRLGQIYMVECNVLWNRHEGYYRDSAWRGRKEYEGGALYTHASHFLDLMIWWCGDVVSAQAEIATRKHAIETEDCGMAALRFETGVLGSLAWTTCVYNRNYEGSITLIGEKGTIKVGGPYLNKIEYWDVQSCPLPEGIAFVDRPNEYGKYMGTSSNHDKVIRDVVAHLLDKMDFVVDGNVGLKSIKAIELIYRSARR
jgi:UDP-N-acetyl-2-amino-2-deoxyglucuronate dehydrogenase